MALVRADTPFGRVKHVMLNGVVVKRCVAYDIEAGFVEVHALNGNGLPFAGDDGNFATERRFGMVEVEERQLVRSVELTLGGGVGQVVGDWIIIGGPP